MARAGYRCELTGRPGVWNEKKGDYSSGLVAHHIYAKPNYALRFSLDNGVCITIGQHFYTHVASGNLAKTAEKVRAIRPDDSNQRLDLLVHVKMARQNKTDLAGIVLYLRQELVKYSSNLIFKP
jgi:hypothetical protein